jgi:hypothetical protein
LGNNREQGSENRKSLKANGMKNFFVEKLSGKLDEFKKTICNTLNDKFKNYSARKKKILLICFCALCGSISICIVINTFYEKSKAIPVLKPVSIPYHIGKNFKQPGAVIDAITFNRVEHFKHYLDSLKINNTGRYTEVMNARPHLYDSILAFEKLYVNQIKK